MKYSSFSVLLILLLAFVSCTPRVEMDYLKNVDQQVTEAAEKGANPTIQPGDQLAIGVTAEDMLAVTPFNQNLSNINSNATANTGTNVSTTAYNTSQLPTFVVSEDGTINYPVIGQISTTGKTISQFTTELTKRISKYVINPVVNIRNTNFKVTVLGQVNRPGTYTIPDGQATLLSALGLAGDLTIYGIRSDVLIARTVDGQIVKQKIDLTNDFINSPYYYLKQNDVIYVSGNENIVRRSRLDPNAGLYISVASVIVTILALVFK